MFVIRTEITEEEEAGEDSVGVISASENIPNGKVVSTSLLGY